MIVYSSDRGREWSSSDVVTAQDGTTARLPAAIEALWSDDELAAWGLERFTPALQPSNGPPPVPPHVSPLQARRALRQAGMLGDVKAFMATASEEAQEAWDYAVQINRDDPMLEALAKARGMSDEQLDDLFRLAATL